MPLRCWLLVVAVLLQCANAAAQPQEDTEKALSLLDEGLARQGESKHWEAITLLNEADRLLPHPKIRYFKAKSLRAVKRYREALDIYANLMGEPRVAEYKQSIMDAITILSELLRPVPVGITTGNVADAQVYIGGRLVGMTPCEIRLEPRTYRLEVVKQGYQTLKQTLRVRNAGPMLLQLRLETAKVSLSVECNVAGAAVHIDGKQMATTPHEEPIRVEPGEYLLQVRKRGYRVLSRKISAQGSTMKVVVALQKDSGDESLDPDVAAVQQGQPKPKRSHTLKWLTIVAGVGLATVGWGLQSMATSLADGANDLDPANFQRFDDYASRYNEKYGTAEDFMKGAYAMYAVGGAVLLGGILWFVLESDDKPPSAVLSPAVGNRALLLEATIKF